MKKVLKKFRYGEKGFTLIELLVVIAILGVLAAVAVPNVGRFIGSSKTQLAETELRNVEMAIMVMLVDAANGQLDAAITPATADMSTVVATKGATAGDINLSMYLAGLNDDFTVKSGCTYAFEIDGTVTQTPAP